MVIKNKKILSVVLVIIVLILITFILKATKKEYGNDEESILKVIRSIDGYNSRSIQILEIKDIKKERVVPFLLNNNPGYIQFTKNNRGNYEWNHIEKRENQSFSSFLVHLQGEELPNLKFLFVTNEHNEIAKVELDVNGQVFKQEFKVHESSAAWIDLPKHKSAEYKYKYYDENGNLIDE
ncbi:hypothetical protein [Neobacillus sp. SAB-20_R2A]|uniref:hypothetical protein n=1 Tax=Neobacillus sp. SAB-20_R2A TaxID=3120519 RepID=UPI003C6E3DD7